MKIRGRKLTAPDEPTVVAKPLLDSIAVENSQGNGRLANSTGANESNRDEVLGGSGGILWGCQIRVSDSGPSGILDF